MESLSPTPQPLSLADIRDDLIRQEETIIFALIERSQFKHNPKLYVRGPEGLLSSDESTGGELKTSGLSFMEHFLRGTEELHARLGRYSFADEHAFFPDGLPAATLGRQRNPCSVKANRININSKILKLYVDKIIPQLCESGSDLQYGSSSVCDISVLQALSKRIHYGKFVAESKFQARTAEFTQLIQQNDCDGIMALLTNVEVEQKVIERVKQKAARYAKDFGNPPSPALAEGGYKVDPDLIADLYYRYLIPLNKDVQVEYLLQRLDRPRFAVAGETARAAAAHHFGVPDAPTSAVQLESVEEVLQSVLKNEVGFGVVPIEDGRTGMEKATQAALLKSPLMVNDSFRHKRPGGVETRYFVVSNLTRTLADSDTHAVLLFGVKHEPGSLSAVLNSFQEVNLSCIESIPVSDKDYEYVFYCELETTQTAPLEATLEKVRSLTTFLKVVGSYSSMAL